jgi:hypothetical protein
MDGWMDGHGSFCVYRKGLLFLIPTVEPVTWYFGAQLFLSSQTCVFNFIDLCQGL